MGDLERPDFTGAIARARSAWKRRRALGCPRGKAPLPSEAPGLLCAEHQIEAEREERRESLAPALDSIPRRYRWARIGAPELAERITVAGAIDAAVAELPDLRWLVLRGGRDRGKTSLATALYRLHVETACERGARFVDAPTVAAARTEMRDGGAEVVIPARAAPFVLLDDVGSEADAPTWRAAVAALVRDRHADERPTIVTTWLDEEQAERLYGGGVARRLFDGVVMDLDPEEGA